jgi:hypothetical protein
MHLYACASGFAKDGCTSAPQGPRASTQGVGDLSRPVRLAFMAAPLLLQKEHRGEDRCSCAPSKG